MPVALFGVTELERVMLPLKEAGMEMEVPCVILAAAGIALTFMPSIQKNRRKCFVQRT